MIPVLLLQCLCQVIKRSMLDAFGNDFLGSLLQNCKTKKASQQILLGICQTMLESMDVVYAEYEAELGELPESIQEGLTSVQLFCRAIVALLVPIPGVLGSSAKDVVEVTSCAQDAEPLLCMLKFELQGDFWKPFCLDVTLKAGVAKELGPKLHGYHRQLTGMIQKSKEASDDSSHELLANTNLEKVIEVLNQLPSYEDALRAGATSQLRATLKTVVDMLMKQIIKIDDFDGQPLDRINTFIQTLESCQCMKDDFMDVVLQLQHWQQKSAPQVKSATMSQWIDAQLEAKVDGESLDVEILRFQVAQHAQEGFPDHQHGKLSKLYLPLLNRMLALAPCLVWEWLRIRGCLEDGTM